MSLRTFLVVFCLLLANQAFGEGVPVTGQCDFKLPAGVSSSGDVFRANPCLLSIVPSGKQLVVEFITARVNLPEKQVPNIIIQASSPKLEGGTIQANHQIALSVGPRTVALRDNYLATHMARIYTKEHLVIVGTRGGSSTGEATFVVTWTGYLVDVAQ
jgi:hypothetical protein